MESNGESISQNIKENLKIKDCVNLETISPNLPLMSPKFNFKQEELNKDVLISEEEFKFIFGSGNKTDQTVMGPKVNLTNFQECNFNESVDREMEENSIIVIMNFDNQNPSVSESELEEPQKEDKKVAADDKMGKHKIKTKDNKEEKHEDSKFSIKIEGSAKRVKFPARYKNILATSNNNIETHTSKGNQNTSESKIEKVGCFGCFSTIRKVRNTNMSTLSNHKDYTKRSTNISIKSLKMNDSLTKHRKKKNQSSGLTDDINISKKVQKVNTCRCMIF